MPPRKKAGQTPAKATTSRKSTAAEKRQHANETLERANAAIETPPSKPPARNRRPRVIFGGEIDDDNSDDDLPGTPLISKNSSKGPRLRLNFTNIPKTATPDAGLSSKAKEIVPPIITNCSWL